jgi:hypothetical protein
MGGHAAETRTGQPGVQVEGRRLDHEHFRPARLEVERDRLLAGRADGGGNAGAASAPALLSRMTSL